MRSFIVVSALWAAVVLATPAVQKRDVVTEVKTQYVTEVVTVNAPAPAQTVAPVVVRHRRYRHRTRTSTVIVTASPDPVPSPSPEPAPEPVPSSSVEAPEQQVQPSSSYSEPETSTVPRQELALAPSPVPEPKPAPSPPAQQGGSNLNTYQKACLDHHNQHRANHSAPAMVWDPELENIARQTAQTCVYKHDTKTGGGGYGQNIAAGAPASEIAKVISDQFYNGEVELYPGYGGEPDMSNFHAWGHFSQIAWVDTTHVACWTEDCTRRGLGNVGSNVPGHFTVCNYKPPGNFGGRYGKNVLPPKNFPTLHG